MPPELDWSQPAPTGREARSHFARSQSTYPPMPARYSKPRTPPNVAISFRPRWYCVHMCASRCIADSVGRTITRAAGTEQLRGAAPHAFDQQPSMCHGEQWPRSLVGVKVLVHELPACHSDTVVSTGPAQASKNPQLSSEANGKIFSCFT